MGLKHFETPIHLQLEDSFCIHPSPIDSGLSGTAMSSSSSSRRARAWIHCSRKSLKMPQVERNTLSILDLPFNILELTNNKGGGTMTWIFHHSSTATINWHDLDKSCMHGNWPDVVLEGH